MSQSLITQRKQKALDTLIHARTHAHMHTHTHQRAHDKSVVGLSKSEEVFCLKGRFRQRGSSPSLFNACGVEWGGGRMDDRPGSLK